MTLTPSQRLEAYRWVRKNFKRHEAGPFLCTMLKEYRNVQDWEGEVSVLFPEFWSKRPKTHKFVWFRETIKGNEKRKAVLGKCISEVQKIIKKETV